MGRLTFVAGPLEHLRPLLGPLFAWASAGPRNLAPRLPAMLLVILDFLADQLRGCRALGCREGSLDRGELFRIDAKAEGDEVAIGGWRSDGGRATASARWFSVRLNRRNAPWAFSRGETFRVIASLELMAVLVGVMVLLPDEEFARVGDTSGLVTIGCATDNQGNSFLLDKLMTTAYPLGLVLIELSYQLSKRRIAMRAEWVPRLQNEEADALSNSDSRHFREENRVRVDLATLDFGVLPQLLKLGEDYAEQVARARESDRQRRVQPSAKAPAKRRQKRVPLRESDPW